MEEWNIMALPEGERRRIKTNIEKLLSRIYSDKYDCKITFKFEKKNDEEKEG